MVHGLIYTIFAVVLISLISFVGVVILILRKKTLDHILFILVAFAAGAMLGASFFDLVPESFSKIGNYYFVLIGLVLFFLIESFFHWHHYHNAKCKKCIKPFVYLNLIGDGLHNFIDGVIISAGFLYGTAFGAALTIAIALHEIPQEIGDFAVLIHGGLSKNKALLFNFLSALFAVLGAVFGYIFLIRLEGFIPYIIAIAAGGFIYIAGTDLLPELHKVKDYKKIILQIIFLILGIALISFLS
ncbi:MAG TPA: ZIP family metal transporter [Candidatus Nanoarchaeia archaeon]|nr:ZIP family metal transporter [Candidatus Nanoarchaeia archaeon]